MAPDFDSGKGEKEGHRRPNIAELSIFLASDLLAVSLKEY
jgi:hypothetical protein